MIAVRDKFSELIFFEDWCQGLSSSLGNTIDPLIMVDSVNQVLDTVIVITAIIANCLNVRHSIVLGSPGLKCLA